MAKSTAGPDPAAAPTVDADGRGDPSDAFKELRELLIGSERDQLAAIRARLDDPVERRRAVGDVLPQVLIDHAADPRFAHALAPPVERAITTSVSRNPGPLADALFPVMGPAIRKAVASTLAAMVESLNRTLEHSLSWRSIVWRVEALRTGKSFGEVMLLHTLVYRVEQVFLIERASGLVLHHVREGLGEIRDVDMVSGMLTAIRDFVQDSFRVADTDGLESLNVGELSVWIEQGPHAIVAAVLRGTAPRTFRTTLQSALERLHLEFAGEFEQFGGDAAVFEGARPTLESCLHAEYHANQAPSRRALWVALSVAVVALAVWAGFSLRARSRWNHYVDALKTEPGIVVVSTGRDGGRFAVRGLRDPLARDPNALLAESSLAPTDVAAHWTPYYAADSTLAATRARQVLQPPAGVTLDLRDGTLTVAGDAPLTWLADAGRLALLIPGVSRLDASAATVTRAAITQIESNTPLFVKGQPVLAPGQEAVLRRLVDTVGELRAAAGLVGRRFRLQVVGHTDADGAPESNLPLSRARAAFIGGALAPATGDRLEVVTSGVGSSDPLVPATVEADKQKNRRVTVRVTPLDAPAATGARP